MEENKLYNLAYRHLLYRIHFGFYPTGSKLPTISELCKTFQVSNFTIHSALKMLEKEHFVSLCQGRSAIVTYGAQTEAHQAYFLSYCHAMKEAILDLQDTMLIIWPEILYQGLCLCGEEDIKELVDIANRITTKDTHLLYEFFSYIIQQLGNPLLANLHLSYTLFTHVVRNHRTNKEVYVNNIDCFKERMKTLLMLRNNGSYEELKHTLILFCQEQVKHIRTFYSSLPDLPSPQQSLEPIPYQWNYYTKRPQISFKIAIDLLKRIYSSYKKYEYLPSVAALSQQYAAPVITIRRAVKILNDVGITESINGKGTRVIVGNGSTIEIANLSSPNLKKVLLPYLESVQLILITCKNIVRAFFSMLPEEACQQAINRLQAILASGDYFRTFGVCIDLCIESSQSPSFQEIYRILKYLQFLGYPLNDLKPNDFRFQDKATKMILKSLERKDADLFATKMEDLALVIFTTGKEKLLAGGVHEAHSIALPLLHTKT